MKASLWSTAVAPRELEPALFSLNEKGPFRVLTLRRKKPDGSYSRMRIVLTPEEARELAYSLAPASKLLPEDQ